MGREAAGFVRYLGAEGAATMLLENHEIILRGAVRARIPRADLVAFGAAGDDLVLTTPQGDLVARLGAVKVSAWVKALAKPLPSLRDKLGLGAGRLAFVATPIDDDALIAALDGHQSTLPDQAALAVAQVVSAAELNGSLALAGGLPLWCVTVKGKASPFSDAQARAILRPMGFVDTKSCAVSQTLTATRWQKRTKD